MAVYKRNMCYNLHNLCKHVHTKCEHVSLVLTITYVTEIENGKKAFIIALMITRSSYQLKFML